MAAPQGVGRWSQVWQPGWRGRGLSRGAWEESGAHPGMEVRLQEGASPPRKLRGREAGPRSSRELELARHGWRLVWLWQPEPGPAQRSLSKPTVTRQEWGTRGCRADPGPASAAAVAGHRHSWDGAGARAGAQTLQPRLKAAPEGTGEAQPWPWPPQHWPGLSPRSPRNSPGVLSLAPSTKPSHSRDPPGP